MLRTIKSKSVFLAIVIVFSFACGLFTSSSDWNGIPILPQAKVDQETKTAYSYKTTTSAADVHTFYANELPTRGWKIVSDAPTMLVAKKDSSSTEINIFDRSPDGTDVLIFLHSLPAP
jgi:hypothetical protein